ncbi:MAG: hypothetical protein M1823_005437 [Watsoniomyces obsoletus]|nr:MAG: hypothetical protein M1823_005437 [Watsoniomyces obsoletus]
MKLTLVGAASMLLGLSTAADHHNHQRAHQLMHLKRSGTEMAMPHAENATCVCSTYTVTITGEAQLVQPTPTTVLSYATVSPMAKPSSSSSSSTPHAPVPTPVHTTYVHPGTYSIPASTIIITSVTVVPVPNTSTVSSSGVYTFGGVTTVVTESTTITCPYASVETASDVAKTKIFTTTYVCPSAGTYTVAPTTTTVSESTIWVYPVPTTYSAGTYTQHETVVTVTKTSQEVVCPFETVAPTTTSTTLVQYTTVEVKHATPTTTAVEIHPTTSSKAEEKHEPAPSPAPSKVEEKHEPAPSPSPSKVEEKHEPAPSPSSTVPSPSSTPSSPSTPGKLGSSGSQWAMTYSPYYSDGQCKSAPDVLKDISDIAQRGFTAIRIYGTECSSLSNVGAAASTHNLRMIVGIFIDAKGLSPAKQQLQDLLSWGKWTQVDLIVIGNEVLHNGYMSGSDLAGFIGECKSQFRSSGYTGPITTAESSVEILKKNSQHLCPVLDVIGANLHPFFNEKVQPEMAGDWLKNEMSQMEGVCGDEKKMEVLNLETGWPSAGTPNGAAKTGEEAQRAAIESIRKAVGGRVVFFSYVLVSPFPVHSSS